MRPVALSLRRWVPRLPSFSTRTCFRRLNDIASYLESRTHIASRTRCLEQTVQSRQLIGGWEPSGSVGGITHPSTEDRLPDERTRHQSGPARVH